MELWEVLVPKADNSGKEFTVEFHKKWDKVVREMSGGLTVMRSAKGTWLDNDKLHEEKMIPCRVMCTRAQILQVLEFTKTYYKQIAVMGYKISNEVIVHY